MILKWLPDLVNTGGGGVMTVLLILLSECAGLTFRGETPRGLK